MDCIITNTVINGIQHRSGIIKTDVSDHSPILIMLKICEKSKPVDKAYFRKTNRAIQAWTKPDWMERLY